MMMDVGYITAETFWTREIDKGHEKQHRMIIWLKKRELYEVQAD